jgi:hypothetical protein
MSSPCCLSVHLSVYLSVSSSGCVSVCVCPSVYVSVHVCPAVCVSPLIFIRRVTIAPCCLYVPLLFFFFCAVRIASKSNRRLVLLWTYFFCFFVYFILCPFFCCSCLGKLFDFPFTSFQFSFVPVILFLVLFSLLVCLFRRREGDHLIFHLVYFCFVYLLFLFLLFCVYLNKNMVWWFGWFIPVAPTWSIGPPWNASFHFSFLIEDIR